MAHILSNPVTLRDQSVTHSTLLTRLVQFDERSRNYPIRELVGSKTPRSYTWRCDATLDQGAAGACVGFAMTHELIARPKVVKGLDATFAKQKVYWEAQKIDPWAGGCVDMETTCLSTRGWVGPSDLREGDEILAFDIESETMRWAVVEKVHRYEMPYRKWGHGQFECAVTDNHRWAVRTRNNGEPWHRHFHMTTTEDWKSADSFPRAMPAGDLPTEAVWEDDKVELLAWAICEGHFRTPSSKSPHSVDVYQKAEKQRVSALMERLGVAPGSEDGIGCHVWSVSAELGRWLHQTCQRFETLLTWLRDLTLRQLRLFIAVCILADGTEEEQKGSRRPRKAFIQRSNHYLDAFLAACAMSGQPVSRRAKNMGDNKDVECWTLRRSNDVEVRTLRSGPYVMGPVWCPQTSVGTFVARRGRSVFITGNSYPGASPFYEGTSVLAGMKVLQRMGYVEEYRWAFGLDDLVLAVGHTGPAVIGIPWFTDMFDVRSCGHIHVGGQVAGGHAILVKGVSVKHKTFTLHNSWGASWGNGGDCKVSWDEMEYLLHQQGEACIPVIRVRDLE